MALNALADFQHNKNKTKVRKSKRRKNLNKRTNATWMNAGSVLLHRDDN